jgi:hypothetical protein
MTFQRAMNNILAGLEGFAAAYLDDVSVQSSSWNEHLDHLSQVFSRFQEHGVTLNPRKCTIGGASVTYLGYQVGSGKVAPIAAKVEAILQMPEPCTKKELRGFLGTVGFYRRFLPRFADIAVPLTNLLQGNKKGNIEVTWTHECKSAFHELKEALAKHPILKAPNFEEPFEIYTDASEIGISAVLMQIEKETPKPVSYYSRKLLPRERNYATIEKELLAIIAGLDAFKAYVGHGPVTIHSDHNPLVWLKQSRTTNQRVLRWALILSEYDLEIRHIKGLDNRLADLLSRQFMNCRNNERT